MDPDETLAMALEAYDNMMETDSFVDETYEADRALHAFHDLHLWITNGGFLPTAWCGAKNVSNVTSNIAPPPVAEDEPKYEEPGDLYDEDERRIRNQEFPLRGRTS